MYLVLLSFFPFPFPFPLGGRLVDRGTSFFGQNTVFLR